MSTFTRMITLALSSKSWCCLLLLLPTIVQVATGFVAKKPCTKTRLPKTTTPYFASVNDDSSSNDNNTEASSSDHQNSQANTRRKFLHNAAGGVVGGLATAGVVSSSSSSSILQPPAAFAASEATAEATKKIVGAAGTAAASNANKLVLPEMGLGAWAWGDSLFWGYNPKNDDELKKVFDYAVTLNAKSSTTGTTLFDTAELYGLGRSEKLIGEFAKPFPKEQVTIATKFAAVPWRTKPNDVVKACQASVDRLDGRQIDLYQIHFPNAWSNAEYWDGLALAYEKGLVRAVGVSNYGVDAVRACHAALKLRGIPLATNQIQFSLLYTWPEKNGLLQTCRDLGVEVLSYSPLALGGLTGKYGKDNLPSGPRKKVFEELLTTDDYSNLLATMKDIAKSKNQGGGEDNAATLSQVAINWTRAKGTIPIPGARTLKQVQQNYQALDWTLTKEETKVLDDAAAKVTTFITPDKGVFPKKDINTDLIMFDS